MACLAVSNMVAIESSNKLLKVAKFLLSKFIVVELEDTLRYVLLFIERHGLTLTFTLPRLDILLFSVKHVSSKLFLKIALNIVFNEWFLQCRNVVVQNLFEAASAIYFLSLAIY